MVRAHAHPEDGYVRHPWVETFLNVVPGMDRNSDQERRIATAAYFGLCSFLDYNIGCILEVLEQTGLTDTTRVIYTSDHGDMVGSRGQWGKTLLYDDSAGIPLIMAGPDITANHTCDTPVSLVDLYPTIMDGVGKPLNSDENKLLPGRSFFDIAMQECDSQRIVLSEYHAFGAPSGAFMLRQGRFKFIYYVGFEPELFDLERDPQELDNLAADDAHGNIVRKFESQLKELLNPEKIDARAKADQAKLIQDFGGIDLALRSGTEAETPAPKV